MKLTRAAQISEDLRFSRLTLLFPESAKLFRVVEDIKWSEMTYGLTASVIAACYDDGGDARYSSKENPSPP